MFPGVLITVVRADIPSNRIPPVVYTSEALLQSSASWERIDHIPKPQGVHCFAVCQGLRIDPVLPAFFPRFYKSDIALRVCRLEQKQATVFLVDNQPPLEIQGEPCSQTAVVVPYPPCSEASEEPRVGVLAVFLDLRPLGIWPRLVTFESGNPDLPDILGAADVVFPDGLCGVLLSNTLCGSLQVLRIGSAPDLASVVFRNFSGAVSSSPPQDSVPAIAATDRVNSGASGPGSAGHDHRITMPAAHRGHGVTHDAHEALGLAVPEDLEEFAEAAVQATFVVFAPRFHCEVLHLELPNGCDVDTALHEVAASRRSDSSMAFDCLLPADPQPDLGFASVLAVPVWADYRICLVDARLLDNRLYAQQFSDQLSRSSILVQIGVRDSPGLRVFLAGVILAPVGLYDMPHGGSIVVVPPDVREDPRFPLRQFLQGLAEWHRHSPFLDRGASTEFLMLSDGLPRVLPVDLDGITNSAGLKAAAAEAFRFDVDKITVCPALPRILDLAYLGHECQAVLAATESISRIPIPPGRLLVRQHMVFLDMRLLLADVSWLLAPQGVVEVAQLERHIQHRVPFGHSLSITGGRRESRGYREFIHVAHGEVLNFCFVKNRPSEASFSFDSPTGRPPSDQEDPPSDEDEEESDSAPSASTRASPTRSQRSRSPKPCTGSSMPDAHLHFCALDPSKFGTVIDFWVHIPLPAPLASPASHSLTVSVFGLLNGAVSVNPFPCHDLAFFDLGVSPDRGGRSLEASPALISPRCRVDLARGTLVAKTLDEPPSSTAALTHALAFLRYAAPRLGPAWRYRPPAGAVHVVPDSGSELDDDESEPEPVTIHVALLMPGFVFEHVTLDIVLPATLAEAFTQLQIQRCPDRAACFPLLVPARPQPIEGNGVVLALPAWCATELYAHRFLCFDTSLIDGRLFTTACPPYVSRRHLLHLAHLPRDAPVQVYVGGDQAPRLLIPDSIMLPTVTLLSLFLRLLLVLPFLRWKTC